MNPVKALWRRLFGDPIPTIEYCGVCHTYDALPGTHLCPGPLVCGGCGEEIVIENPPGAGRHNAFWHVPCPGRQE